MNPNFNLNVLEDNKLADLQEFAQELGIKNVMSYRKAALIEQILAALREESEKQLAAQRGEVEPIRRGRKSTAQKVRERNTSKDVGVKDHEHIQAQIAQVEKTLVEQGVLISREDEEEEKKPARHTSKKSAGEKKSKKLPYIEVPEMKIEELDSSIINTFSDNPKEEAPEIITDKAIAEAFTIDERDIAAVKEISAQIKDDIADKAKKSDEKAEASVTGERPKRRTRDAAEPHRSTSKKAVKEEEKADKKEEAVEKPVEDTAQKPLESTEKPMDEAPAAEAIAEPAPEVKAEPELIPISGILEVTTENFGFIRSTNFYASNNDVYVSSNVMRRMGLRPGDKVEGGARYLKETDRFPALYQVKTINGVPFEEVGQRKKFDSLVPIFPNERLTLEKKDKPDELATRLIDLIAPIGKGQRGLIVSPPKAGKTVLLKKIANSITQNHPDVHLIVLLIDERPEEVTDMQRSTTGEVVYSTFDELPEHHTRISENVLEYSKRLVEMGKDVVILLDSITRLARAYNLTVPVTGRTLSGGLDPSALFKPKKFFGAARNIEGGGSLTIIATALVDTGSRMDEVIFEEFKGTGNMELHLDRKLSEKRVYPAIDINRSSTRREDLLLSRRELEGVELMRKHFSEGRTERVTEMIINNLTKTPNNQKFVASIRESFKNTDGDITDISVDTLFDF